MPTGRWPSRLELNSSTSSRVHSGGLSQPVRSRSNSRAASAIRSDCSADDSGNGKVSKHVGGVGQLSFHFVKRCSTCFAFLIE